MWCGTANADLCQLIWSTKCVLLRNSYTSSNITIRNGSAELHTKRYIAAASGGKDFSHFFLMESLKRDIRIAKFERKHKVSIGAINLLVI